VFSIHRRQRSFPTITPPTSGHVKVTASIVFETLSALSHPQDATSALNQLSLELANRLKLEVLSFVVGVRSGYPTKLHTPCGSPNRVHQAAAQQLSSCC
jgi:hypothetical protein